MYNCISLADKINTKEWKESKCDEILKTGLELRKKTEKIYQQEIKKHFLT